ncbi:MAG: hypothetical protein C0467_21970 [Planctomycetaceae bacterium]|nr:hypothetical protein [Planctomycetaceae bacterium]
MNLLYEVADSKGRAAYANTGKWFGCSNDAGRRTRTRHVGDACFSKTWGNEVTIRLEQIPFVIRKTEVLTEPFK